MPRGIPVAEFRVDPDELDELAAELRRRRERLVEVREGLAGAAEKVAGRWAGEARERFVSVHGGWQGDQQEQETALERAAGAASDAATTYREVDRAVKEMFE